MIYFNTLLILCFAELLNIITKHKYKIMQTFYFFLISVFLFIISAFRNGIGYDFDNYYSIYNKVQSLNYLSQDLNIELGFLWINEISSNFHQVIFICSVLGVIIKVFIINQYSSDKLLSLIMYFTGVFLTFDMGVIRQGISISICLLGLKYILNKQIYKYLLVIICGSLFHISSLVFIPLYFIGTKRFSRKFMYISCLIILLISFFNLEQFILKLIEFVPIEIIITKLTYYSSIDTGNITISLIKRVFFLIVFVESYRKYKITDNCSILFLNSYFLSIIFMGLFSSIEILGGRGSTGLYFMQIFIFAVIIKKNKNILSKLLLFLIVLALSINTMKGPIMHGNQIGQSYTPYESIKLKDIYK